MKIKKEHFLDKGEQDEQGFYDYYYEGDVYEIAFDNVVYGARSYTDNPQELSFHSRTILNVKGSDFSHVPYEEKAFFECINHFKNELGFKTFRIITSSNPTGGYEEVKLEKFTDNL